MLTTAPPPKRTKMTGCEHKPKCGTASVNGCHIVMSVKDLPPVQGPTAG